MTLNSVRLALKCLTAVATIVAVAAVVVGTTGSPSAQSIDVKQRLAQLDKNISPENVKKVEKNRFGQGVNLDRRLQRPVVDPPPPKNVKKTVAANRNPRSRPVVSPLSGVKLVGLFLAHNRSYALLETARDRVEVRRVGDLLEYAARPAKLVQIHSDSIVLEDSGRRTTLKLESRPRIAARDVK